MSRFIMPVGIINKKAIEKSIQEWTEENSPYGKKLGYPDCCIKEFCDQSPFVLKHSISDANDHMRFEAAHIDGAYSGFIPCVAHAKEIIAGKITLASLIKDRSSEFPPFPNL